ncbi:hypothetical protein M0804_008585 [Polistes exclamans]|nr:hypothetical protein M0804_008585 [Polistes exclamans]
MNTNGIILRTDLPRISTFSTSIMPIVIDLMLVIIPVDKTGWLFKEQSRPRRSRQGFSRESDSPTTKCHSMNKEVSTSKDDGETTNAFRLGYFRETLLPWLLVGWPSCATLARNYNDNDDDNEDNDDDDDDNDDDHDDDDDDSLGWNSPRRLANLMETRNCGKQRYPRFDAP